MSSNAFSSLERAYTEELAEQEERRAERALMSTPQTPERLRELAAIWEQRAKDEEGKTEALGWCSRERKAAEHRRDLCLAKRDMCVRAAALKDGTWAGYLP